MLPFSFQMARLHIALWTLVVCSVILENEAQTPLFLRAITSALSTIPFTAGPLSTGLVGAKLAVGSKLLYYLGFFGRRKPKSKPPTRTASKSASKSGSQFPGGMQPVPMPYAFGGGFPQQFGGFPGSFGNPYGIDPAVMYQMLAAQGIDPATAMQAMTFDGGAGGHAVPSSQFPFPTGKLINFQ